MSEQPVEPVGPDDVVDELPALSLDAPLYDIVDLSQPPPDADVTVTGD